MSPRKKGRSEDWPVINSSNHPRKPNTLECLVCGERWILPFDPTGIPIDQFSANCSAFTKKHRSCAPKTPADRAELNRRLWWSGLRTWGASADAMWRYALLCVEMPGAGGDRPLLPSERPHDAGDLAACFRRRTCSRPLYWEHLDRVLEIYAEHVGFGHSYTAHARVVVDGILCLFLCAWCEGREAP